MEQVQDFWIELKTERLLLRPYKMSDAGAIANLLNNLEVSRWTVNIPYPYSREDADTFIEKVTESWIAGADATFAITLKEMNSPIGACGAHLREPGEYELGYWLGEPYWGKGYMTEAVNALVQYLKGHKQPKRIYAGHAPENPGSENVLLKAGFKSTCEVETRPSAARGKDMACHILELPL